MTQKPGDGRNQLGGTERLYRLYTTTSALADVDVGRVMRRGARYFRTNFARHLPSALNARILDIGCGYGKNLHALAALGYTDVRGIDVSEEQVAYARDVLGMVNVEQADAFAWLANSTEQFDCILLIDVLEHLTLDGLGVLSGLLHERLARGGRLIVQVPNDIAPLNPIRCGDLTHLRAYTAQSLRQFFANAGLVTVAISESLPPICGPIDFFRRALWHMMVRPVLLLFYMFVQLNSARGIPFTSNMMGVAEKK